MLAASLPRTGFLSLVLFLIACGLVVLQAYFFNWKLDDAYITFSYARNWVEGHGIVFNVGERVEGYTCFLWVALSALGLLLGASIEAWSTVLGVAFALGTLAATAGLARELLPPQYRSVSVGAALLLAFWPPLAWWAASGMETTLFTFLVTAAFWAHVRTEGRSPWVGVIAALAALTRPEGWLLGGLLAADAVRLQGRRGLKVGAAFAGIFVPYFVWRTVYYGYLLPNTFYAKVGSTFDQVARGWVYLKVFLWNWGLCLFAAAPIAVVTVGWKRLLGLFTFLSLYTAYVVSVGGDVFHFFRFWAPIVPVLCALAYSGLLGIFLRTRIGNDRLAVAAIGLTMALWLALATRASVHKHLEHVKIANGMLRIGQHICGCLVRNTKPDDRIAALGIGVLKWCSNRPVIDMLGLTDLHIARKSALPMGKGLAGHEKYDSTYVLSLKPKYIQVGPLTGRRSPVLPAEQDMWQQPEFLRMYEKDECGYRRKDDVPEAKK